MVSTKGHGKLFLKAGFGIRKGIFDYLEGVKV